MSPKRWDNPFLNRPRNYLGFRTLGNALNRMLYKGIYRLVASRQNAEKINLTNRMEKISIMDKE
jgi:hypothetical protein